MTMYFKTKVSLTVLTLLVFPFIMLLYASNTPELQKQTNRVVINTNNTKTIVLTIKETEDLALKGNAGAQYQMARHYLKGTDGVVGDQDFEKAEHWFRLAADQGHTDSIFGLAFVLSRRAKTTADEIEIARLFGLAAEKGNKAAQYSLAMYILSEKANLKKDINAAVNLLKKSAAQNNPKAHIALVEMAHKKECDIETGKQSLEWLKNEAEKENPDAQYKMGVINEQGYIIPQDLSTAIEWYTKAALNGLSSAHMKIGQLYESGSGVEIDYKEARQFYENAVEMGEFKANWNLAQLYEKGRGVKKNDIKAAQYYFKAARLGHPQSMTNYGRMLLEGRGIEQSDQVAAKWLTQAAAWGDADGQYYLGKMYKKGLINVEFEETDKLKTWLRLARGVFIDPHIKAQDREGNKWLKKAADQGHEQAIKDLEKDKSITAWFLLIFGVFIMPFSIGLFKWPEVAERYNPFVIRYISAPLLFLMSLFLIIDSLCKILP